MLDALSPTSFQLSSINSEGSSTGLVAPTVFPSGLRTNGVTEALSTDFGAVLGQLAQEAISTVKQGEATAVQGIRGQATTLQVVEALVAAEETLQTGIAIRDKVVSAYLEISRMTI